VVGSEPSNPCFANFSSVSGIKLFSSGVSGGWISNLKLGIICQLPLLHVLAIGKRLIFSLVLDSNPQTWEY
jgi:hypothetical protein